MGYPRLKSLLVRIYILKQGEKIWKFLAKETTLRAKSPISFASKKDLRDVCMQATKKTAVHVRGQD